MDRKRYTGGGGVTQNGTPGFGSGIDPETLTLIGQGRRVPYRFLSTRSPFAVEKYLARKDHSAGCDCQISQLTDHVRNYTNHRLGSESTIAMEPRKPWPISERQQHCYKPRPLDYPLNLFSLFPTISPCQRRTVRPQRRPRARTTCFWRSYSPVYASTEEAWMGSPQEEA